MKRNLIIRDQKTNEEYLNYLKGNYDNLSSGFSDNDLVNNRNARRKMLNNDRALDKVKRIITIKELDLCNVKMVAHYFEVPLDTIQSVIKNNRDELMENGMRVLSGKEIKNTIESIYNMKYNGGLNTDIPLIQNQSGFIYDNQSFNNRSNILLNRRCVLNIAMLLRDSIVAKDVRRVLLNMDENYNAVELEKQRLEYNNYNNRRLYDEIIENRNIIEKQHDELVEARNEIKQYIKKESMVESFINYITALNKITYEEYEDYMNKYK